jgi:hypothetical protein
MVPELRPRGIGEMLDAAVALYRARFGQLVRITLAVIVPVQILNTLVLLSAEPDSFRPNLTGGVSASYDSGSASMHLAATLLILMLTVISTAFVAAVCSRIVADAYTDQPANGDALRTAGRRLFAVIGLSLLLTLMQAFGVVACFVGTFVVLALFSVSIPALILEGVGVGGALARSYELAKANFWRALGLVLTAQLLTAVLNLGLAALVAVDAPTSSYLLHVGPSVGAGLTAQDAEDVLIAVAPIVGAPRAVSAAVKMAEALDLAISFSIEESQ